MVGILAKFVDIGDTRINLEQMTGRSAQYIHVYYNGNKVRDENEACVEVNTVVANCSGDLNVDPAFGGVVYTVDGFAAVMGCSREHFYRHRKTTFKCVHDYGPGSGLLWTIQPCKTDVFIFFLVPTKRRHTKTRASPM